MPETRPFPSRPILLAAALGVVLAVAGAFPAVASSPPALSVEDGAGETAVRYVEDGVEVLAAVVTAGPDTLEVRGTVAGLPYSWRSRLESDGTLQVSASLGEDTFAGVLAEGVEDSPDARAFRAFRERAGAGPAGEVVRRVNEAIDAERSRPLALMSAAVAAANGAGAVVFPQDSPFGEYTRCLKDSCGDCGGCWSDEMWIADCYFCRGTTFRQRALTGVCYTAQVQICFSRHIFRYLPR